VAASPMPDTWAPGACNLMLRSLCLVGSGRPLPPPQRNPPIASSFPLHLHILPQGSCWSEGPAGFSQGPMPSWQPVVCRPRLRVLLLAFVDTHLPPSLVPPAGLCALYGATALLSHPPCFGGLPLVC
jgi:hypothetical protein